jgi:hypothetical protein
MKNGTAENHEQGTQQGDYALRARKQQATRSKKGGGGGGGGGTKEDHNHKTQEPTNTAGKAEAEKEGWHITHNR